MHSKIIVINEKRKNIKNTDTTDLVCTKLNNYLGL